MQKQQRPSLSFLASLTGRRRQSLLRHRQDFNWDYYTRPPGQRSSCAMRHLQLIGSRFGISMDSRLLNARIRSLKCLHPINRLLFPRHLFPPRWTSLHLNTSQSPWKGQRFSITGSLKNDWLSLVEIFGNKYDHMFPSQFNSIRTVQCLSTPDNSSTLLAVNPLLFFNANYNLTINHVLFMIYVFGIFF